MKKNDKINSLLRFITDSPTPYHVVEQAVNILSQNGFKELKENDSWEGLGAGSYYVTRNLSSLIAFHLQEPIVNIQEFRMGGAHTDSPCLKVKPSPIIHKKSSIQIGIEVYGGALLTPWFDRDLSLAGCVSWHKENGPVQLATVDYKRPIAVIPSLAIHLDREANNTKTVNKQTDIIPLAMMAKQKEKSNFSDILKKQLTKEHPDLEDAVILDHDLFFYDTQPPSIIGLEDDYLTGARFDNLLSCYCLLDAIIHTSSRDNALIILNNHEEVGSVSTTGAQGTFLQSVLQKFYPNQVDYNKVLHSSFLMSVDNAHAMHPNFTQKHDEQHMPELNKGIVLKKNANQRYATDSLSGGIFKRLCSEAKVPFQEFVMRNDMACGSTIGPITSTQLGVPTVDVGVPQLAMHSIRETVGREDVEFLCRLLSVFFNQKTKKMFLQA